MFAVVGLGASAQNEVQDCGITEAVDFRDETEADVFMPEVKADAFVRDNDVMQSLATPVDSLALPKLNNFGQVLPVSGRWYGMYPMFAWFGWNNWELHKGLNMNIGASVFAQFGNHARHGAGFSQNVSAMYATTLTDKLSLAVGGYFNNVYWGHDVYRDAGLSAVLGYRFDERWEAYIYGQKSLMNNNYIPYSLYDMHALGDRIGAAVKYNFSKSFSITLSVEKEFMPDGGHAFRTVREPNVHER